MQRILFLFHYIDGGSDWNETAIIIDLLTKKLNKKNKKNAKPQIEFVNSKQNSNKFNTVDSYF